MRKLLITIGFPFLLGSCISGIGPGVSGNGNVKSEVRQMQNFTGVHSAGSIDVEIITADKYEITVENDENLLQYVTTTVDGGVLLIRYKDDVNIHDDHAKVYVTAPSLKKVVVSGSANISFDDGLSSDRKFEVKVSGSGDIEGGLDAPEVIAVVSGSGNINLHGRTRDLDASSTGSGDLNFSALRSENARVRISGSGNARVFASVSLDARTAGSGDIYYGGHPNSPKISISGSGSVTPE